LHPFALGSRFPRRWEPLLVLAIVCSGACLGASCHNQSSGNDVPSKDPQTPAVADVTLPGVDTSALTPREKAEWSTYVSELLAPCSDTPVPIAQCVKENRPCPKCTAGAKYVLKGVRDGQSKDQIDKSYKNRFDPAKIRNVPIDGSPSRGPESAPITVIEFADFECPFCAMFAPVLEKMADERKSHVRFVFKFLPLAGHPHGEIAARAGFAGWQQNKFWEMNHKLFANRDHLEQSDLESYAKDLGLDVGKFKTDMASQAATDRIAQDRKLADSLEVKGTPTIYINGRDYDTHQDINDWINLELGDPAKPGTGTGSDAGGAKVDAGAAAKDVPKTDAGKAGAAPR
jgi:protein-disulfide isomerase